MALVPERERLEQWMREILLEVALDPRQVAEVLRLAVALVEPGEESKDFGRALRAHRRIGRGKAFGAEAGIGRRATPHIERGEPHLEIVGHVDARVLQ